MAEYAKLFMKVETNTGALIDGESEASGFLKQIELSDWSWNLSNKSSNGVSSGKTGQVAPSSASLGPKVVPGPLVLSKRMDRSTTGLLSAMTSGQLLRVWITLTESVVNQAKFSGGFHLAVNLTNARVIGYDLDGEVEDTSGELRERWTLNYETIEFRYKPPEAQGRLSVELRRQPGDSTAAPEVDTATEDQILDYAKRHGPTKTIDLLKRKAGPAFAKLELK